MWVWTQQLRSVQYIPYMCKTFAAVRSCLVVCIHICVSVFVHLWVSSRHKCHKELVCRQVFKRDEAALALSDARHASGEMSRVTLTLFHSELLYCAHEATHNTKHTQASSGTSGQSTPEHVSDRNVMRVEKCASPIPTHRTTSVNTMVTYTQREWLLISFKHPV